MQRKTPRRRLANEAQTNLAAAIEGLQRFWPEQAALLTRTPPSQTAILGQPMK
jgi:hypothetical protein